MKRLIIVLIISTASFTMFAQTTNDVLDLLKKNKTITQEQADSFLCRKSCLILQNGIN